MAWYWWILTLVGYLALLIVVAKLTSPRGFRIFLLAALCGLILAIPYTEGVSSHLLAVFAVLDFWIVVGPLLKRVHAAESVQR